MKKKTILLIAILIFACLLSCCSTDPNKPFAEYKFKDMTFEAPDEWNASEDVYGFIFSSGNYELQLSAVNYANYDVEPIEEDGVYVIPDDFYDENAGLILKLFEPDGEYIKSGNLKINGNIFKEYEATGLLHDVQTDISAYYIYNEGYLYTFYFTSISSENNSEYKSDMRHILDSVHFS